MSDPIAPMPSVDHATSSGVVLPSIAVLPFADLSQAHDQGYFSDGLTEEILDRLNGHGTTIVLVTHSNEVAHRAARILRVADGLLVGDDRNLVPA